jgi:N-acetyl-gamma-glutamyl-phosphate reductase
MHGLQPSTARVAVLGASGYTGAELLRLLSRHPRVEITVATADRSAGRPVSELYPQLTSMRGLRFSPLNIRKASRQADVAFVALPPGESSRPVSQLLNAHCRVIDLGADFRLRDHRLYPKWYHWRHRVPHLLSQSVYGLPEFHRDQIVDAQLVANPGCYPTAALLGLGPLARRAVIDRLSPVIIDAKSGLTGAGRSANLAFQLPEAHESIEAYQLGTHRHTPEIEQELGRLAGRSVAVTFIPHLVPMSRGLLATIYVRLRLAVTAAQLGELYAADYATAPFVRIRPNGPANPKHVRGTNYCEIGISVVARTRHAVITSAIDNLGKGAAGQAVQNLNLMMGWPETLGLDLPGLIA